MKKKILVAEDDGDILLILQIILKNAGYDVQTIADGSDIINNKIDRPDLFILDKDLPGVDGLSLCKFLKLNKETAHIPIIMITCFHYLKNKATEVGADDFIEKPFEVQHLLETVEKYMTGEPVLL
jgi:DNA-binding response OmpR family regulator